VTIEPGHTAISTPRRSKRPFEPAHHTASLAECYTRRALRRYHPLLFVIGLNPIESTTNLLAAQYLVAISSFMLVTMAAVVVGKTGSHQ
jgi:hypothetical protein